MRTHRLIVVALHVVATLPAQVFIVDAAGGAGSHFTDLPQAVAAVPDGSTLRVRAGTYSPMTLQAKGLSIVGEGLVRTATASRCVVRGTAPGQRVLLRNLELWDLWVIDAAGPVAMEDCTFRGWFWVLVLNVVRSPQVRLSASRVDTIILEDSTVEISRCQVRGFTGPGIVARRSRCTLVDATVIGGDGALAYCRFGGVVAPPGIGHPACDLDASTLLSCNSSIVGGTGGDGVPCIVGAGGGTGVKADRDCAFLAFGALPAGGAGGGGIGTGPRGRDYVLGPNSRIHHSPNLRTPIAWVSGTQNRGQTVQLELRAAPASIAVFAFSYTGLTSPLEPLGIGSFLGQPALVFAPLTVPTSGSVSLAIFLPATLPLSEIYTGQALTWQPLGLLASNAFPRLLAQ